MSANSKKKVGEPKLCWRRNLNQTFECFVNRGSNLSKASWILLNIVGSAKDRPIFSWAALLHHSTHLCFFSNKMTAIE